MRSALVLIAVLLFFVQNAPAQNLVQMRGVGGLTCGDYSGHRRERNAMQDNLYVTWTWAFMTSYNWDSERLKRPQVDLPSDATILAYLDKFCAENPLRHVVAGVVNMIDELSGRKPRFKAIP